LRHVCLEVSFFLYPNSLFTFIFLSQFLELSIDIIILFLEVVLLLSYEPDLVLKLLLHVPGLTLQLLLRGLALRQVELLPLGLLRQLLLEILHFLVDEGLLLLVLALDLPEPPDRVLGLSLDAFHFILEGLFLAFELSLELVDLALLRPERGVSVDLLGLELVLEALFEGLQLCVLSFLSVQALLDRLLVPDQLLLLLLQVRLKTAYLVLRDLRLKLQLVLQALVEVRSSFRHHVLDKFEHY